MANDPNTAAGIPVGNNQNSLTAQSSAAAE